MDYDIVIPTFNRSDVLEASIPRILSQNRPPRQLIIVDASDEHERTRQSVLKAVADSPVVLQIIRSPRPNIALQRDIGLKHVSSPVVMFTDDDVFWWQGVGEAIMRIYERDTDGHIGGVCGVLTTAPPPETRLFETTGYNLTMCDRVRQKAQKHYNKFISIVCPDPFCIHGKSCWNIYPVPQWLFEEKAVLVEYMGGARMSFRTEAIQNRGFDKNMAASCGYAKAEDAEISFYVAHKYLLVGTHNAKIYHHKHPSARAKGFELGLISLLNHAYIVCLHSPVGSPARHAIKRFSIFKLLQYMLEAHTKFGCDRVRGALLAIRSIKTLLNTPSIHTGQCYLKLCAKSIKP